jgi:gluconokinase
MMHRSYVVMGTAGAGKSVVGAALAQVLGLRFVEGDQFHPAGNVALMAAGTPLTDEHRAGWLAELAVQLHTARERGEGIVLTCSALKRSYRDQLRAGDPDIRFVFLHGDAGLLRTRLEARRGHYMPASLLDSQLAILESPAPDERAWSCDVSQTPEQIVSDIVARIRMSPAEPTE